MTEFLDLRAYVWGIREPYFDYHYLEILTRYLQNKMFINFQKRKRPRSAYRFPLILSHNCSCCCLGKLADVFS